jgi:hypothetical protein
VIPGKDSDPSVGIDRSLRAHNAQSFFGLHDMIVFVRPHTAALDSRINKYFTALSANGLRYTFIGWDRSGGVRIDKRKNENIWISRAHFSSGWGNLFPLIRWNMFVLYRLSVMRHSITSVQCIDLDAAITIYLYCIIFRIPFILDLYDNFSSSRGFDGKIAQLMNRLETFLGRRAALTIVASPERIRQHALEQAAMNILVLENVPANNIEPAELTFDGGRLKLGYFGVLERKHRGIEDLLDLASACPHVDVHIAGYGPLETIVQYATKRLKNVFFYGPMTSSAGLEIMRNMHVLVGFYYRSNLNHEYAAPNKYYEHLMLGRGLLTTIGTPPGLRVQSQKTGWAIKEGFAALREWAESVSGHEIVDASHNALELWTSKYKEYYRKHYLGDYVQRVRAL